ncbi:MAG: hypothetical protein ACXVPY_02970 [Bacteroidia bacterium]
MDTIEKTTTENTKLINLFVSFLSDIGIEVEEDQIENETFLPGLEIRNGVLIFDRKKLIYSGDLLHEAGHIAVSEASLRKSLNGNVIAEKPERRGEELAAMLWSYAVCKKLNISPEIVFHKDGYKGDSEWILNNYKDKTFIGLPLLVWMGMTYDKSNPDGFPVMRKWLRD